MIHKRSTHPNDRGIHWICISNFNCDDGIVNLYDSSGEMYVSTATDRSKMHLCCMPHLTCFYNTVGFTFAFKMFMFILISNYVYSMLQPPFSVYFISCSIPTPFLFILCQGQSKIKGYVLGG